MSICDSNRTTYTGNGNQVRFPFSFEYLKDTDLQAGLWNELTNEYDLIPYWADFSVQPTTISQYYWTLDNATTVRFLQVDVDGNGNPITPVGAPRDWAPPGSPWPPTGNGPRTPNAANVMVQRMTDIDPLPASFYPGSSIRAQDLNDNFEALQMAIEEGRCADEQINNDLDLNYWNKTDETIESTEAWIADDEHVFTALAGDQRYLAQSISGNNGPFVSVGDTPPAVITIPGPQGFTRPVATGDLWFNTDNANLYTFYVDANSSQWVNNSQSGPAGPAGDPQRVHVGPTPPTTINGVAVENGDLWFNNDTARLFVFYVDPNSSQWVDLAQAALASGGLPIASASVLGGIKVGNNLSITADGTLSANAGAYTLPEATDTVLGGVKIGANINVTADGTISTGAPFDLPVATDTVLGGIKVGNTLTISNEVLDFNLPTASASVKGGVKVGDGLSISSETLSLNLPTASASVLGGIKVGNNLSINGDGVLSADGTDFTLPVATSSVLGGVKIGSGVTVAGDGTISVTTGVSFQGSWTSTDSVPSNPSSGEFWVWDAATNTLNNANWGSIDGASVQEGDRLMFDGTDWVLLKTGGVATVKVTAPITTDGDSTEPTIGLADNGVTFAKFQNIGGNTLMGRNVSGSGDASDLTMGDVRTLLNVEDGAQVNVNPTVDYNVVSGNGTITVNPGGDTAIVDNATTSRNGLMLATDKSKLDGIDSGAQANVNPTISTTTTTSKVTLTMQPGGDTTDVDEVASNRAGLMTPTMLTTLNNALPSNFSSLTTLPA